MELPYNLTISEAALAEFEEAFYYYQQQQSGLENNFAEIINTSFVSISTNPFSYQKVLKAIRQYVVKQYPFVIHYKIDETKKDVLVLSVFHTASNPKEWKRRI